MLFLAIVVLIPSHCMEESSVNILLNISFLFLKKKVIHVSLEQHEDELMMTFKIFDQKVLRVLIFEQTHLLICQ